MVEIHAFKIAGLKIWFWSNDHEPPHFHAKKSGEWEVKVHFLLPVEEMLELEWSVKTPHSKTLKELCRLAEVHRASLLRQWEQLRGGESS